MKKNRTHIVDTTKTIEIYDNVFNFAEQNYLFEYVKKCAFRLNRVPSNVVLQSQQFKTLLSEFNIYDLLKIDFFTSSGQEYLRNKIVNEKYRLHRAYVNLSTAQDVYHYHVDSHIDNDFTLLYYCNNYWEENWEGETHFGDDKGSEIIHSCSFKPNRIVLFSGTIPHKSSQPSFFAREFRYVLTLKFTHPSNNDYLSDFPIADFFLDKDYITTKTDQHALEFLENYTKNIPHSKTTLFNHLKNTWQILKRQNCSDDVCLAGMFHSIYGTEFFNKTTLSRDNVRSIIGDNAEDIVYRFCTLHDRDRQLLDENCLDKELIQIAYANLVEEKFRDMSHETEIIAYKNKLIKIET